VESDISIWANGDFSIWRLHKRVADPNVMEHSPVADWKTGSHHRTLKGVRILLLTISISVVGKPC